MRTTLSLNDHLFRQTKIAAAKAGDTLSAFVEQAIRERLSRVNQDDRRPILVIPKSGGTVPGVDLNSNAKMADLMDEWDVLDRRERADLRNAK